MSASKIGMQIKFNSDTVVQPVELTDQFEGQRLSAVLHEAKAATQTHTN